MEKNSDLKRCATDFYGRDMVLRILGESLHPGGLSLTQKAIEDAMVERGTTVLDVASGPGETVFLLADEFRCKVVAVDLNPEMASRAAEKARKRGLKGEVAFVVGDAERLPFRGDRFDYGMSECSVCLFPDKEKAISEMARVVKPSGRVIMTDVTLSHDVPTELRDPLLHFTCIAGAEDIDGYVEIFERAGLEDIYTKDYTSELMENVKDLARRYVSLDVLLDFIAKCNCSEDFNQLLELIQVGKNLVKEDKIGYALITGSKKK